MRRPVFLTPKVLFPFQESKDSSKPITADDVRQVFENLAKKRRRIE
jgi:hypothetical protein